MDDKLATKTYVIWSRSLLVDVKAARVHLQDHVISTDIQVDHRVQVYRLMGFLAKILELFERVGRHQLIDNGQIQRFLIFGIEELW